MRLLHSELLKLRTTRVPFVLMALTVVFTGLVVAAIVHFDAAEASNPFGLAQAAAFWSMLVMVLGILIVTNEYRHRTITTTFLADPRRERVLGAKLVTALLAGAAVALAAIAVIALVALPWLAAKGADLPLGAEGLEAAARLLLSFALSCALGAAVGAVLQNQVGAIVGVLIWFLIVENIVGVLSQLIFGEIGEPDPVTKFLPGSAFGGIVGGQGREFLLAGGWAALVATGYLALFAVLGAVAMRRRDPS